MKKSVNQTVVSQKMRLATSALATLLVLNSSCSSEYKTKEAHSESQVATLLDENHCLACHTEDAKTPFYGSFPVIGAQVKIDMERGLKAFDIAPMMAALKAGKKVGESDMAKVEYSMLAGTMPLAKYYVMHWESYCNDEERSLITGWAKKYRAANYASPTVAKEFANEPVQPLPNNIKTDRAKVALGDILYHDTRLSADNTVSCATCHGLETGGVDRLQFSKGIKGQFGGVNAPTVYNSGLNKWQFWDGRAADLQEQAAGPPLNPVEMGHKSFDDICALLAQDEKLTEAALKVYPDGWTQNNITDAIAEFEKTLLTPSRFDHYLMGDKNALTASELKGYEKFKADKCATCHVGQNLGGQSFEYVGVHSDYFEVRGSGLTDGDNGRFAVTKKESDRHKFKTPTLRNVALTYPYMHDGTVKNLEDAVVVMYDFQVGVSIDKEEMKDMMAFLNTLTGEDLK